MTGVFPIHRHVDDGAHVAAAVLKGDLELVHQFLIAGQHGPAIHHGLDAPAGDLLDVGDPGRVWGGPAGGLDGQRDGMGAEMLRQGGQLQQFLFAELLGVDHRDLEGAPGEGAVLSKTTMPARARASR